MPAPRGPMELFTHEEKPNMTALLAAVVAAFIVASAAAFALDNDRSEGDNERVVRRDRRVNPRVEPDDPSIVQAPWRFVAVAAQAPGKPTQKQKRAVKKASRGARETVQDLYDALTVSRDKFDEVSRRLMPKPARNELRGRTLVPFSLERIKTTKREAKITIDVTRRISAAARVELAFRAERGNKRLSFRHRGTLWLERGGKRWRVIAFDLDQRKNP